MKSTSIKTLLHALLIFIGLLSLNAQAGVEITYIHNDALGSPVAGTDEQGNVKWRSHYQPYGEEVLGERQLFGVRTGYTGHRDDPETGLTYMGARYYSPALGRFMGVDPAGVSESNLHSFNRYAYANNNPYKYVDPNGESPLDVGFLLVDSVKLAIAIQSGVGVGAAFGDFAASVAGVVSPVPGVGQAIKAGRATARLNKATNVVNVSRSRFPESAKHIEDAIASGKPNALTINRAGAAANRKESLRGVKTKSGLDRDEFPPAMFQEGGKGASVRHINPSDNRGAGACIGSQCRGLSDGARVRVDVVD